MRRRIVDMVDWKAVNPHLYDGYLAYNREYQRRYKRTGGAKRVSMGDWKADNPELYEGYLAYSREYERRYKLSTGRYTNQTFRENNPGRVREYQRRTKLRKQGVNPDSKEEVEIHYQKDRIAQYEKAYDEYRDYHDKESEELKETFIKEIENCQDKIADLHAKLDNSDAEAKIQA